MAQPISTGALPDIPRRMTYEEFLEWGLRHDVSAEWVDGEVCLLSPVSIEHDKIVGWLYRLLAEFVEAFGLGEVFMERVQMKTGPGLPGREPDLLFVAAARAGQVKRTYVDGPADVAVEVISDESRTRDRREKFVEYETGGVTEYWLIDPDSRSLECYERGDDGRYRPAFAGSEGVFRSAVVEGFRFRVEWLWERPPLREALAELGVR